MPNHAIPPQTSVLIHTEHTTFAMGRTARVEAVLQAGSGDSPQDYILLPYVNQRRWGSHERPDAAGRAVFMLPLPNPGPAGVQVLALKADTDHWMGLDAHRDLLLAGRLMPDPELGVRSNTVELEVAWRPISPRPPGSTLFGMQWEPWFNGGAGRWGTAQAVPVMGFYDSWNRDALRQHMLWLMDAGIDFILADWTNHIWGCKHWNERPDHTNAILHATQLALEVLAELRSEGLPAPKMVLFPGLSNGRPATIEALNEQLAWIYHHYVRNPRFEGLWLEWDGKPLVVVLDTGAVAHPKGTAESAFRIPFFKQTLALSASELDVFRAVQETVDDEHFTVRWMSSQNETTRHHELGYWSWMDGTFDPPATYRDGAAEAVTVTPAFFNAQGWAHPSAAGRRGGATYFETFKAALQHRPRVVFLHQFNEYSGQPDGRGYGPNRDIYVDTYNVELSDDLEPVSLTAPGYRGGTGGWGFYYLNLTRALIDVYRGRAGDCTLLAVSRPLRNTEVTGDTLQVEWNVLGASPHNYTVSIDGQPLAEGVTGTSADIRLAGLARGPHLLTVAAPGATTRYPLSLTELDIPLAQAIPARVDVPFTFEDRSAG